MKASRASGSSRRSAEPGHRQPHGRPGASRAWRSFSWGVYVNLAYPQGLENLSLLRCSLSAAHTDEQVEQIIEGYAASLNVFDQPQAAASAYA